MAEDDVTQWIMRLADGDEAAAQAIWERYFERLVHLARKKLEGLPRRVADEEDVALSAMKSFCRAVKQRQFPRLKDRNDLWKILVTITINKAAEQCRWQRAQKRGGGYVRGESVFHQNDRLDNDGGIDRVLGDEPTPQLAAVLAETCQRLLEQLRDETLKKIAVHKMEGYTNTEIAEELNCTVRTVERKLARIRKTWEQPEA
jgi:RNA polymerase sigma factor (sigma-70 family)